MMLPAERALRPLERLLAPRSVAVVGASPTPGKAGNALMTSLGSFPGPVYAVNPRAAAVGGRPGFARVAELPGPVDLALVVVPAPAVLQVVEECAAAGLGGAVVHSG